MGAFTSKATGDWSAEGATTWNEANYPGKLGAGDTVTIQNGHTVTLDITNFPGGALGAVSVQSGGKLIVNVVMDDITKAFGGNVTVADGGELEFTKTSGASRKLFMGADLYNNGLVDMDSSAMAAGETLIIAFDLNSDTFEGGSTGEWVIKGRTKTQKTLLSGAVAAAAGSAVVDDVTGWEDGDELVIAGTDPADWDAFDHMVIDTGGISGNTVTFTGTTTFAHADNARVYNLTCSSRIQRNDTAQQFGTAVNPADGATVAFDYVQFDCCGFNLKVDVTDGGGATPLQHCTFINRHASGNSRFTWYGSADGIEIEDCIFYKMQYMVFFSTGFADDCTMRCCSFINCPNSFYQATTVAPRGFVLEDCEWCHNKNTSTGWLGAFTYWHPDVHGGYAWSNATYASYHTFDTAHIRDFDFGYDPGGNGVGQSDGSTAEITWAQGGQNYRSKLLVCDRCKFFAADDDIIANRGVMQRGNRFISYNHDRIAGAYFEANGAGFVRSDTAQPRSGTKCICIDGRSVGVPPRLEFRFVLTVADGDNVTITYYAKKSGGITSAVWRMGHFAGGFGGIATGSDLGGSITTSYAQYTITFNNVAAVDGDVELVLDVVPADGTDDFVYLDDIEVTFS